MEKLAIDGGPKAFAGMEGTKRPKIGVEEFMSVAERFGFKRDALDRIRQAVSDDDLREGAANLARYYCPFPDLLKGPEFEALAKETFGVSHALSVSSGTAALHSAFVAAGVKPGTEVIVPAIGFMATAAAVMLSGGVPVFCDVDESLHMDPTKIEGCITSRTVALAPTHHWGGVTDMDPVMAIADEHGLKVIEDCAQSPGARYRGRPVGSIGDVGCFSISAYKIIGGGEGGLLITSDERLYERACQLAECGGLWRPDRFAPPRYEGELFVGTNYRMSELEAAVDVVQLAKLDDVVRRYRAARTAILEKVGAYREIVPQKLNDPEGEVGYLLRFFPETVQLGERIVEALKAEGVSCRIRGSEAGPDWHQYSYMYPLISAVAGEGERPTLERGACPVADDLYDRCVAVSVDQWYSPEDCANIANAMNKVFSAYCEQDNSARAWL